jgi:two-component system, sensor histidine kinase and response regulator
MEGMKKVLVIDDSPEIRLIIEETLGMFGFATVSAEDGETGVSLARRESPDLIICDVNMPKMDGFETLSKLREVEMTASIPFMFLSGAVDRPQIRRGMEMGADDYLTKPFTPTELLAAVNARLEKQKEIQRQSEKKLDELRGKMTLALPHELRTPLNGIMGLANILMEDHTTLGPEDIYDNARFIHDSALRLHRLIENFLAYAQIELASKDPGSMIASAAASVTPADPTVSVTAREVADRYGRAGELELSIGAGAVAALQDNFRKIIEELVDNAFKFSAPGSRVRVHGALSGVNYVVRITDHGRGMTPQQIAAVAPHVQFEREKYEQQGAGLGLTIAQRLTELNGGQFSIESAPDVETTAIVFFPARPLPN